MFAYPQEFLDSLASLGLAPTPATPPSVVRAALNDLYRYELRTARDRLRAGAFEKSTYLDLVVSLRKKYWLLTLPLTAWDKICREGA
ncbi:MAG TPA: hypothetical protein VHB78_16870 [Vicinamibacterales bacterium]|nr:hypothetical protein [Vicinamibacterales bacterium]